MSDYKIEIAKDTDLNEVLELILGQHEEAKTFYPPYNKNLMMRFMKPVFEKKQCIILIKDKKIVGAIAGLKAKWWFSDSDYMADIFFFIDKKHRTFKNARGLLQALKKIAHSQSLPLIVGTFDANDIERKDMLYQKLEFRKLGLRYGYGV